MDMYNILIFVAVGAIVAIITTGGLAGMIDLEATPLMLGGSAVLGAVMAAGVAIHAGGHVEVVPKSIMSAISSAPDMKVGLPNF